MKGSVIIFLALASVECSVLFLPLPVKVLFLGTKVQQALQSFGLPVLSWPTLAATNTGPANTNANVTAIVASGSDAGVGNGTDGVGYTLTVVNSVIKVGAGNDSVQLIMSDTDSSGVKKPSPVDSGKGETDKKIKGKE